MLLLALAAHAEPLFVAGARVAAGVAVDGSLCDAELELCLQWDPPGEAPLGEDLLWPGDPVEVWSASWSSAGGDTTIVNGAPHLGSDLPLAWTYASGPDLDALVGTATTGDADVSVRIEVPWDGDVVWVTHTVTPRVTLTDLAVARVVDADVDYGWSGSYATDNLASDGVVVAAGTWDGRAVALASPGGHGAICDGCTTPAEVLAGEAGSSTGDDQLALAVELGYLAPGQTATVRFAYGFGADSASAAEAAVAAAADADHDDDGADSPADCDDADATVFPGAQETTDGRDEDCDGAVDEGSPGVDDDHDGWTEAAGDCDDADADVHPGAAEVEGVVDADCNGAADVHLDPAPVEVPTGGCASVPAPPWLFLVAALLLRRRP